MFACKRKWKCNRQVNRNHASINFNGKQNIVEASNKLEKVVDYIAAYIAYTHHYSFHKARNIQMYFSVSDETFFFFLFILIRHHMKNESILYLKFCSLSCNPRVGSLFTYTVRIGDNYIIQMFTDL